MLKYPTRNQDLMRLSLLAVHPLYRSQAAGNVCVLPGRVLNVRVLPGRVLNVYVLPDHVLVVRVSG